jgi:hypothetical protein
MARSRLKFAGTPAESKAANAYWLQVWKDNAAQWYRQTGKQVPLDGTIEAETMLREWCEHMAKD